MTDTPADGWTPRLASVTWYLRRHPTLVAGGALFVLVTVCAVAAPLISGDPLKISAFERLKPPSAAHWFGTDMLGHDVYARTIFGGRVSLIVGVSVAAFATAIGCALGLVSGFSRRLDPLIMRTMDGLMSIPTILIALALVALTRASIINVIFAITVVEVPRVVRLVRGIVLSIRELPYVDAAISVGSGYVKILTWHIMPNTIAPVIVQATFICAQAILIEAALSFIGAGSSGTVPTWGTLIADGRVAFQIAPWIVFFPGAALSITVLAVNLLGDGLRDTLDPRLARRM